MTAVLESRLEAELYRAVRGVLGGMIVKLAPLVKGTPDRLVLLPGGRMYLVELKTDVGRLSPAQVEWHRRAALLGITVVVLHGRFELKAWVTARTDDLLPEQLKDRPRGRAKTGARR